MFGKGASQKTCGRCRYFVHRRIGSFNLGLSISKWGLCEGNRHRSLGGPELGLVRDNWTCRLNPPDWKPRVRAPPGLRCNKAYDTHPFAENREYDNRSFQYEREYALEREKELKQNQK